MSMNATDPSELFGGTQERIKNRFVFAAGDGYEAGSEGGSETHSHTQNLSVPWYIVGSGSSVKMYFADYKDSPSWTSMYMESGFTETNDKTFTKTRGLKVLGDVGSSSSMPPYLVAYMWYRVA